MVQDIRGQFLAWFGIIGAAITIVGQWSSFIQFANNIQWIVGHWNALLNEIWVHISSLTGVHVTKETAIALSAAFFLLSITAGSVIIEGRINKNVHRSYLILLSPFVFWATQALFPNFNWSYNWHATLVITIFIISILIGDGDIIKRTEASLVYSIVFLLSFQFVTKIEELVRLTIPPLLSGLNWDTLFLYLYILAVFAAFLLPIVISPASGLIKRLSFMLIGIVIIFALNEVSKRVERFSTAAATLDAPKP
jgi:hypothetical protein